MVRAPVCSLVFKKDEPRGIKFCVPFFSMDGLVFWLFVRHCRSRKKDKWIYDHSESEEYTKTFHEAIAKYYQEA